MRLPVLLLVLQLLGSTQASAESLIPYLVTDLTHGKRETTAELHPFWSHTVGEVVFFGAGYPGAGMWRTDGTRLGTYRIYDGVPDIHLTAPWLVADHLKA